MKRELIKDKPVYYLESAEFEYDGQRFRSIGLEKDKKDEWWYDIKNMETGEKYYRVHESKLIKKLYKP